MNIGTKIHIYGHSCTGKSTMGALLADRIDLDFVELDGINFEGSWKGLDQRDPERFMQLMRDATTSERWVAAGSYTRYSQAALWDRVETVILLDLPLRILVPRLLRRSWKRWRTKELLWGSNQEKFWPNLKIWNKEESLLAW